MENNIRNQAVKMTMRIGLASLALVLWHAPAVKAQECCPDSYTAAEMAKMETLGKKPALTAANRTKNTRIELVAKLEPGAATPKVERKQNSYGSAKTVAVKQPVKATEVQ